MEINEIAGFYDKFAEQQANTGINIRIYGLYKRAIRWGLNKNSNVLELGCGIGTVTFMLSKKVTNGKIESVDLSPKSIEFAQKKLQQSNINLNVGDVVNYEPKLRNLDIITLFDVIEHIPLERHSALFKNISKYMGSEAQLLINIPNPDHIEYMRKHRPKTLQVIDQSIPLGTIVENVLNAGLDIQFFEKYSLWVENDYCFYVITKQKRFEEELPKNRTIMNKIHNRSVSIKTKLFYKY